MLLVGKFKKAFYKYVLDTCLPFLVIWVPCLGIYGFGLFTEKDTLEMCAFFLFVSGLIALFQIPFNIRFALEVKKYKNELKESLKGSTYLMNTVLITKEFFVYYGMFIKYCIPLKEIKTFTSNQYVFENAGRGYFSKGVNFLQFDLQNGKKIGIELDLSLDSMEVSEVKDVLTSVMNRKGIPKNTIGKITPSKLTPYFAYLMLGVDLLIVLYQKLFPVVLNAGCVSDSVEVRLLYKVAYSKQYMAGFYAIGFVILISMLIYVFKQVAFWGNSLNFTFLLAIMVGSILAAMIEWPNYSDEAIAACKQDYIQYKEGKELPALPEIEKGRIGDSREIGKITEGIEKYPTDWEFFCTTDRKVYFWAIIQEETEADSAEFHYYFEHTHLMIR